MRWLLSEVLSSLGCGKEIVVATNNLSAGDKVTRGQGDREGGNKEQAFPGF